jgi:hypothetical protein
LHDAFPTQRLATYALISTLQVDVVAKELHEPVGNPKLAKVTA